jgi:hypothetical protein
VSGEGGATGSGTEGTAGSGSMREAAATGQETEEGKVMWYLQVPAFRTMLKLRPGLTLGLQGNETWQKTW